MTQIEVFIWPGRIIGEVPIKWIRISFGWTFSTFGNQLAALLSQGCGEMPSNISPSFQRPPGTPPLSAALMSSWLEGSCLSGAAHCA